MWVTGVQTCALPIFALMAKTLAAIMIYLLMLQLAGIGITKRVVVVVGEAISVVVVVAVVRTAAVEIITMVAITIKEGASTPVVTMVTKEEATSSKVAISSVKVEVVPIIDRILMSYGRFATRKDTLRFAVGRDSTRASRVLNVQPMQQQDHI